ncbi:MAG: PSD1 and planctomycete cytochrome C domain-containing protein, partial [Verrucomicrobiota bacterium]
MNRAMLQRVCLLAVLGPAAAVAHAAEVAVDFAKDVRPIFADHCYSCHGPEKQKAGLRLDRKAEALRGGDSGKAILPRNSAESDLLRNVAGLDPDLIMPPEGKERLTPKQVETLRAWIDAGAPWPEEADVPAGGGSKHWAFRAPTLAKLPRVKTSPDGWGKNPIDTFVLARLEKEGIAPSPEADRATLLRRLSLDLLGLPPTPEEIAAFVEDKRARAYERVVERLLESPHFGERWGRHWLDLARYADSDGYEKDTARPYAYLFRDWTIDAINRDLPFDRFTLEQLAGDLLPKASKQQKVATGFHRQTLTNREGGVDKEEFRTKAVVDRVSTTGTTWLGLTVGCAECHSHKFDPISQREFYQLYAFFNDASEKDIPMPQPSELEAYTQAMAGWEPKAKELQTALDARVGGVPAAALQAWDAAQPRPAAKWAVVRPTKATIAVGDGETQLTPARDGTITTRLRDTTKGRFVLEAATNLKRVTGFRVEALEEIGRPIGRGEKGDFALAEFAVFAKTGAAEPQRLDIAVARADFAAQGGAAQLALDGKPETGWSIAPQTDRPHTIVFELKTPFAVEEKTTFMIALDQSTTGVMNRLRLGITGSAGPLEPSTLPDAILAVLRVRAGERTEEQRTLLARHFVEREDDEGRALQQELAAHNAKKPKAPETTAAVLTTEERKTQIHIRGDFLRKGDDVQPGTPAVLPPLTARAAKPDRLDLARWLVDSANPLTARVAVNHVWKNLFGRALVGTVDDFGTRGDAPTHPELLDWLALKFSAREGPQALKWSRKALIKQIVTSAAYRQSSRTRPELEQRDPNNLLLARQNRFRLEAETVRDGFLAASGLLNPAIGGPSIRPPLPADIAALGYANSVKWQESTGTERYRRGLYIFFQRTVPYPMLMTFDAPDSNTSCTRRERSNTPLQALTLLNDPVFFECAQVLGRRVAAEAR